MALQRNIDVRAQGNLGVRRTLGLCLKGIRHRLLRSLLTLAVIALAVAFFMYLLGESALVRAVGGGVSSDLAERRHAVVLLARLFEPPSRPVLTRRLAEAAARAERRTEFARVTGWHLGNDKRLGNLCVLAREEQRYLAFVAEQPPGRALILFGRRTGRDALAHLADPAHRPAFLEALAAMPDAHVPGRLPAFLAFLDVYADYERDLAAFNADWRVALDRLAASLAPRLAGVAPDAWLREAASADLDAWAGDVAALGFAVTPADARLAQAQLRERALIDVLTTKLGAPATVDAWRRLFRERKPLSIEARLLQLDDPRAIEALAWPADRAAELPALAAALRREARLNRFEQSLAGRVTGDEAGARLGERQLFLLVISFLVCMVGIANAMLMSITERFREIATMKCLGATDRFILVQFMMEAGLLGVAGGLAGMAAGAVVALLRATGEFGLYVFAHIQPGALAIAAVGSWLAGILLAVLASVYPAWAASRMAPMDAMRIE